MIVRHDEDMSEDVWLLHRGEQLVAKLRVVEHDFPWVRARVDRRPGFEVVAPLFDEELQLLNELDDHETVEWTAAYERIRAETSLTDPAGVAVAEYLLHIDGDDAWWRWSDEPFDDRGR